MPNPPDKDTRNGKPQKPAEGASAETTAVDAAKKKPAEGANSKSTPKKTA
jgi:hypothetical protein